MAEGGIGYYPPARVFTAVNTSVNTRGIYFQNFLPNPKKERRKEIEREKKEEREREKKKLRGFA